MLPMKAVSVLVALALVLISQWELAEARYLPTRSADEADVEVLKELIRGIIDEANLDLAEERAMRVGQNHKQGAHYQSLFGRLNRRSVETIQASPGDKLMLRQIGSS